MTILDLLGRLRAQGIELRAEADKLVVNAPKGALTPELGNELRSRKAEILTFLRMGADASNAGGTAKIPRATLARSDDGALQAPLSFTQGRLFYLDQLEPGLSVYNVPVAFWLVNELDVDALRAAINDVVQKHAVLRTTLRLGAEGPVQHIAPALSVDLSLVDLSHVSASEREPRLRETLTEHASPSFDLAAGPLFRTVLIRLSTREHVLLVTAHHVVTDGWSQDVFERDLLAFYEQRRKGAAPSLAIPEIQYADYAVWQLASSSAPERARRLAYWREALPLPLPVLALPSARVRPQMAPSDGDTAYLTLPGELLDRLNAIGRQEQATLFMVLLAGYATLLHRVSGQDVVVVGTPIANRNHAQTLDLIGFFANTLALRIDLSGAPTFRELVCRVRDVCVGAYANQDVPFEELVDMLGVPRDLSRSPVFQTIFGFEDALPKGAPVDAAGTSIRIDRRDTIHAKVARNDLSTWVTAVSDGLRITFEYPTALFDHGEVERLLESFGVLLHAATSSSETSIDALPLLSTRERQQVLLAWNDTACPLPDILGAHQLFERQVERGPDRVAVIFGSEELTYRELDERANRLAHHLVALGAVPGAFVGVFFERSAEMLIALLAVLKLGGTYVPLDPEYPEERVALMIEDSGLGFIVTTDGMIKRLPRRLALAAEGSAVRLVVVDRDASAIAARSAERPANELAPGPHGPSEHASYAIYTSGSTGKPNGVLVPHRALVNFLQSMAKRPGLTEADTLLAVTTLSFDIAGLEMFLPLSAGAKLVIGGTDQVRDGRQLRALLESTKATFMQATPGTWRMLIAAGWTGGATFKALCGGEAFPPDLVLALLERVSQVWNMYGPTETTIWSTCTEIDRNDPRVTVGRPIDNTSIYVLDRLGQPVGVGVPGELMIGGLGVSLGYLNRPELTSARFVPDPFSDSAGARMYKTGDVAAWREDGQLVYHGRADYQVKVRGYRIELGEIETVLREHEAVDRCVVIVREDRPGDARVVAYVVLAKGRTLTASDVRKHLRKKLPDYMIPQHVVELEDLPLTPAGKIARQALPAPAGAAPTAAARLPATPQELLLARIWKDVLRTERIAATDNFFEVGGHSLLSMVVVARIQAETGVRVDLRDLLLLSLEQVANKLDATPSA